MSSTNITFLGKQPSSRTTSNAPPTFASRSLRFNPNMGTVSRLRTSSSKYSAPIYFANSRPSNSAWLNPLAFLFFTYMGTELTTQFSPLQVASSPVHILPISSTIPQLDSNLIFLINLFTTPWYLHLTISRSIADSHSLCLHPALLSFPHSGHIGRTPLIPPSHSPHIYAPSLPHPTHRRG